MRISDWSSDVCSSDLRQARRGGISMHAHHHHDASEPELALPMPGRMGEHLDIARERQLQRIRAASERHRLAKSAIESLNAQLTRARMEKEHAYRELRDLMHGRTNVVIGNTLIRFTDVGGVALRASEVVRCTPA